MLPWLPWHHRLFWLDEYIAYLKKFLINCEILNPPRCSQPIESLHETTVVMRHDLDSSRSTSYLKENHLKNIPAVHAVLRDSRTKYWVNKLKLYSGQESAFHYNTIGNSKIMSKIRIAFGIKGKGTIPASKKIIRKGLLKQVQWARNHDIGIQTLHRHGPFIIYPEYIDALEYVFDKSDAVLGASSYCRGQCLRWGIRRMDTHRGFAANFPDVQFPYWFPFKLSNAARGGVPLKGWETSCHMEISPELVQQVLDYEIPGISQNLFILNYHPAHAEKPTFVRKGSITWYRKIINILKQRQIKIITLSDLFRRANKSVD